MKYKFILKKIQYASIDDDFDDNMTIDQALDKIAQLSEEELGFNDPDYYLESITRETSKISKIIWMQKTF